MAIGDVRTAVLTPTAYSCALFDGVDDYIEIPHNDSFVSGCYTGMTVSAWGKALGQGEANVSNGGVIISKGSTVFSPSHDGAWEFSIRADGLGRFVFYIQLDTSGGAISNSSALSLKDWYHLAVTATPSGSDTIFDFYVNGVLNRTLTRTGVRLTNMTGSDVIRIGNQANGTTRTFDGYLRDVRVYNRALTAAEIAKLALMQDITHGLIGHWKLNGNAQDSSGNGNHGTVSGVTFVNDDELIANEFVAARVGATDKFFVCDINKGSSVVTAAIAES